VRADANARTSGGLTQALRDIDRAIALEGRNAKAWRLRGDLPARGRGDLNRAAADLSKASSSIRRMRSLTSCAASSIPTSAGSTARSPTTTRRSS